MKTIWKWVLPGVENALTMPKYAKILCVQAQHEQPCIWALVDDEEVKEIRRFVVRGTGFSIDEDNPGTYIGTFQVKEGNFVFHVFEITSF